MTKRHVTCKYCKIGDYGIMLNGIDELIAYKVDHLHAKHNSIYNRLCQVSKEIDEGQQMIFEAMGMVINHRMFRRKD